MKKNVLILLILAAPLFLLIPHLGQVPMPPQGDYSDLLISHYPNALYLKQSIFRYGQIPWWGTYMMSGFPFSADPLSGLWYAPAWIAALLPFPIGFNLIVMLHLFAAGCGMYVFLRLQKIEIIPAIAGGLILECLPKLFAHFGAGHISLVYAFCWTPWLLSAEIYSKQERSWKSWLPGAVLGMIILADVRWAFYSGLAWLTFSVFEQSEIFKADIGLKIRYQLAWQWILSKIQQGVFALMIAAPLLIPFFRYLPLSTRVSLTQGDRLFLSLPPMRLLGLLFPDLGGMAEWIVYFGTFSVLGMLWLLFQPAWQKRSIMWLGIAIGGILLSLGELIPGMRWISQFPGMDLLRVPPRFLLLTGLSMAVLAGFAIQGLIAADKQPNKPILTLITTFVAAFSMLIWAGAWVITRQFSINYFWGAISVAAFAIFIILRDKEIFHWRPWLIVLIPLIVLDVAGSAYTELRFTSTDLILDNQSRAASYLGEETKPGRIYSPSYSIPQYQAVRYNLELADGIDPLQLSSYAGFMQKVSGVASDRYSVTIPAFPKADPSSDNATAVPDLEALGQLNVRFIASEFDLSQPGLVLRARFGSTRIYELKQYQPRTWIQKDKDTIEDSNVLSVSLTPNLIRIRTMGRGTLMLSGIAFPAWKARLDDQPTQIMVMSEVLRGVNLPNGEHVVDFYYDPVFEITGMVFALIALLIFPGGLLLRRAWSQEAKNAG